MGKEISPIITKLSFITESIRTTEDWIHKCILNYNLSMCNGRLEKQYLSITKAMMLRLWLWHLQKASSMTVMIEKDLPN